MKFEKILIVVLLLILIITCFSNVLFAEEKSDVIPVYGNIDKNEIIDAEDALAVLKHAVKLEMIVEELIYRADVDGNNSVDSADALEILKFCAGIIDGFNCGNFDNTTESPTVVPTEVPTPEPEIEMPSDFSGTIWIFGDSIAAYHTKEASVRPLYGWGEVLGDYFTNHITINNHAISSQSTSSYYNLKKTTYNYVFTFMKDNDYVFISFGHNDHNTALLNGFDRTTDPEASTDTEYSYKWWLKNYYIDPVLEKGATPILMSSVVRWYYNEGVFEESDIHMKYGKAMEELVAEYAEQGITVYYIDAQDYTYNLYSSMKGMDAMLFHGQYGGEGRGFFDNTHYSEAGARMIAEYIIEELKRYDLSIMRFYIGE